MTSKSELLRPALVEKCIRHTALFVTQFPYGAGKKFHFPVCDPSSRAHARSALAMRMHVLLLGLELRDLLRLLSVECF